MVWVSIFGVEETGCVGIGCGSDMSVSRGISGNWGEIFFSSGAVEVGVIGGSSGN